MSDSQPVPVSFPTDRPSATGGTGRCSLEPETPGVTFYTGTSEDI